MLGQFAAQFSAVRWLDDERFRSTCPLPGHAENESPLLARQVNGRIQVACFGGLGHTAEQILSALHSQNGTAKAPKPPAETFSTNGTNQHLNGASQRSYALAYAKYGIPVFPLHSKDSDGECSCGKLQCKSLGKHPRHKDWQAEATIDPAKIRDLWSEYPSANIGVACGKVANLTVLDVDGEQGKESLRELELEHGELPDTPMVRTGSGGVHYYFQYDPQVVGRSRFAPGLDWRTEGNLVVGVGSHNANGPYLWDVSYSLSDLKPSKMPDWLKNLGQKSTREVVQRDTSYPPVPIAQVARMLQHIDANDRTIWLQTGMALKAEYGVHGRALWDAYSKRSAKYDPEGQAKAWASIDVEGGIGIGTVVKWAKDAGWLPATNGNGQLPAEEIDPDLILRPLDLPALYTMLDEWLKIPWVWQGILPHGSLSLLVGKSESGKSTFVYALIFCIVNGLEFLGRQCEKGRVLYLAGDPASEFVAAQTFRALGLTDDVLVIRGALVGNPYAWQQFRQIVNDFQPTLIVLDTLSAAINLDTEKYGQSQQAQQPLTKLARDFNPNILSLHHSQKSAIEAYNVVDAALGSVGVAAVASTRMVTRAYRRGGKTYHTFEMSNLRIGQPLEGEWILEKHEDGLVELGSLWNQRESRIFEEAILNVVKDSPDDRPPTQSDIRDRIGMKISRGLLAKKLSDLVKEGKLDISSKGAKKYTLGGA